MQTKASIKKNRYKFAEGEYAWVVPEDDEGRQEEPILVKVEKRLLRPFRESQNFYLCEHCDVRVPFTKIHYEGEMKKIPDGPEYYSHQLF